MSFHLGADGVLRWQPWEEIPWLVHGFSTRGAGDFSPLAEGAGVPTPWDDEGLRLTWLRQIHSDLLLVDGGDPAAAERPEGDGLLTRQAGLLLGIRTADCLPLLFVDRRSQTVSAVHAGWRGTAKRIAARAVETLHREFGVMPSDLEVAVGPGIGSCCYEVGPEVAGEFDGFVAERDGRPHLDLVSANRAQLREAGVPAEQVRASEMCTACATKRFYSYRKEGAQAGRMLAVVGIKPV